MSNFSINYVLTQEVVPLLISKNKEFILNKVLINPINFEYFLTKDALSRLCKAYNIQEMPNVTANVSVFNDVKPYFVFIADFNKEFVKEDAESYAIALVLNGEEMRYFTYEKGQTILSIDEKGNMQKAPAYYVCEVELANGTHKTYGNSREYSLSDFVYRIIQILKA